MRRACLSWCFAGVLACNGSSGTGDAGSDAAAADVVVDAPNDAAQPIVAPNDIWTWVDFPESKCASGTPTGIAVNPHAGATSLLVYFEGGGACTDATSCWGSAPAAANLGQFDATTFAAAKQVQYPILNRKVTGNPMSAMNMVYIPYCTGDMHAGTTMTTFTEDGGSIPTYFWGGNDVDIFLARLVPTFSNTTRVWIAGTSAGGFASVLDWDRVQRAFGVRTDIIDDSGPPIPAKGATSNAGIFGIWGVIPPTGCNACDSLRSIYDYDRQTQPSSRYAFLTFAQDTVISARFNYTLAEYPAVMSGFSSSIASDPNAATYIFSNEQSHVVESDAALVPEYMPWLVEMVSDSASWTDATYP
jgi:hypothetical protein